MIKGGLRPKGIARKPLKLAPKQIKGRLSPIEAGGNRKRRTKTPLAKANEELEAKQKEVTIKLYGTDCFTCPAVKLEGKNLQLGHVPWPRSVLSSVAKFDHRYTRSQCMVCNIHRGGMGAVAYARMVQEGIDVDSLWRFSLETKGKTYSLKQRHNKITEYQSLLTT